MTQAAHMANRGFLTAMLAFGTQAHLGLLPRVALITMEESTFPRLCWSF